MLPPNQIDLIIGVPAAFWKAPPSTSSLPWGSHAAPPPTPITHSHSVSHFLSQCMHSLGLGVDGCGSVCGAESPASRVSGGQRPHVPCLFSGPGTENLLDKSLLNECPVALLRSLCVICRAWRNHQCCQREDDFMRGFALGNPLLTTQWTKHWIGPNGKGKSLKGCDTGTCLRDSSSGCREEAGRCEKS